MNTNPRVEFAEPLRISVALCTFNGAAFLPAQLASLTAQELRPAEVIACDDGSVDETLPLLRRFAAAAQFPVEVHVNSSTLGVTENFGQAIAHCQGELIALCDQDDVWKPEKLARVAECFADDPALDALFSDAELIDAEGRSLGRRLWQEIAFNAREQMLVKSGRAIEVLADRFLATGAALVFRRRLLPDILPMPAVRPRELLHDGWITLIAAATGKLRALPEPLIGYRRHAGQQVGLLDPGNWRTKLWAGRGARRGNFAAALQEKLAEREATGRLLSERLGPGRARWDLFEQKISHLRRRLELPSARTRRIAPVFEELAAGRYHKFSHRPLALALRDLWLKD